MLDGTDEPAPTQAKRAEETLRIAWYRATPGANSPAKKEFDKLPETAQAEFIAIIERYTESQTRRGDVKSLGHDLWEFRVKIGTNTFRLLFARVGQLLVLLNAIHKKSNKTPMEPARTRLKRWKSWNN